ncbi:MAG: glycosyltransferase [Alphaproteobacteria bacterium]|nr:glycosyltransferase [Alphaproteobacteria bacterium]
MRQSSYVCIFLTCLLAGYFFYPAKDVKFYEIGKDSLLKNNTPLKENAITINNCAEYETTIGEVFLVKALKNALEKQYKDVSIDYRLEMYPEDRNDEIQIYMRGYFKFMPPFPDNKHINIAYIIYPLYFTYPNKEMLNNRDKIKNTSLAYGNIGVDELQFYDILAVASAPYAKKMRDKGFNAYYVPQFTNTNIFYYEFDESIKSEVLFVGTKRQYGVADIALKYNLPLTVYGPQWGDVALKEYIDNNELHKYYSSAKIVLNDHREDMLKEGFINNRVFDVTATGTMLISDYMPEIEKIYGDSIPMYKTEEDLVRLVKYYLDNPKEREELALKAKNITLKNFTEKNIGEMFFRLISDEKNSRSNVK